MAFVKFDTTRGYGVHILMPDNLEAQRDLAYESSPVKQLQFSKNGQYYCFFLSTEPHPFESLAEKTRKKVASKLQPPGWIIYERVFTVVNVEKALPTKAEAIATKGPVWHLDVTADISPKIAIA